MEAKTAAQLRSDAITQGNIARLQAQLDGETNPGRRSMLEKLLLEQRQLDAC